MRVYRGRGERIRTDREITERVVDRVASSREPAVRVWRPPRHLAFGRRDASADGYDRACEIARERGFSPVEREVGGRAVAYTGSTMAFARMTPIGDPREGLTERYDDALAALRAALDHLGADVAEGEPPDSFCPGSQSLQSTVDGRDRKLAGLAQRVSSDVAVVAGVLLVTDHDAVASVLEPVYSALGVPFDPTSVGSVALAEGHAAPDTVVETVADALVSADSPTVEHVGE